MKPAGVSGIKKRKYLRHKINELATNRNKIVETCIEE
jgi:hypothetical protein